MKVVVILACLLVLVAADSDSVFQQYVDFMNSATEMCVDKLGMGKEIIEKVNSERESTEVDTVGCVKACVLKNFNIIRNGKVDVPMVHDMIETVNADQPDVATKLKDVTDKCANNVKDMTNECEIALHYVNCCVAGLKDI